MEPDSVKDVAGIVLAGVHNWDDSGFDELLPRPLMPVGHAPLICHVLVWLREAGITHATICGSSASRQIRRTLSDGTALGIDLGYYEDWTPRGPAGCVRDSALALEADRVIVADGTLLPASCDLSAVIDEHLRSGAAMTVVAAHDPDGPAENESRLIPVGIYVLERFVLEQIPQTGYQDIKEVLLPRLHEHGVPVRPHVLTTPCPRLTDAASYLALNAWVLEHLLHDGCMLPGYQRVGSSLVHESVDVPSPDRLVGMSMIGPGTVIAPDAAIVGPTTIGAECVLESQAVICRSVLWDRCRVGRGATVDHYVLGEGVNVEEEARLFHTVWAAESSQCCRLPRSLSPASSSAGASTEADRAHSRDEDQENVPAQQPARVGEKR